MTDPQTLRNVGILAHVDAGKTTITAQMLYLCGEERAAGSVDNGTAPTDFLPVERDRGISVRAAGAALPWKGSRINLIDTPGHTDFSAEVERTLRVLDGAVLVVSAAEGIQNGTELLWRALRERNIPTLIFVNKLDRLGADAQAVVQALRETFSPRLLPLQRPVCDQEHPQALPLWPWSGENAAPADAVEAVAEADDSILSDYLSERPVGCGRLADAAAAAVARSELFPVCFGAALRGVGMDTLLDAIVRFLPPPRIAEGLSGVVYKVEHDATMGKAAHVRLYGGALRNRDAVALPGRETPAKISQIRRSSAGRSRDIGELGAGDIGVVYGLSDARTGDILGDGGPVPGGVSLAAPLLRVQATPDDHARTVALRDALLELADEDPTLDVQWLPEERELHLSILGKIQLEVLDSILRQRFGLSAQFGAPVVLYKETPASAGTGHFAYTMPKPCWAIVTFEMEPLPRGSGLVYSSTVRDDRIFYRYQEHVRKTVPEALKQGLYGWEVTDLRVTLVDGEHHIVHTHPMDFFTATPVAIQDGLRNCGTTLLEPMLLTRIHGPEGCCGRVLQDIVDLRGSFDTPLMRAGSFTVEALVPVATTLDWPARLGAISGGRALLSQRFAGYRPCPVELGATTPYRGVHPLDTSAYLLKIRGALK